MRVEAFIADLIGREGGYVNDVSDAGGETNLGITNAVARAYGYMGEMRDLSVAVATDIYLRRYWTLPRLDQVAIYCPSLAEKLLDIGVNMGPVTGIAWMQRALNVLNKEGRSWPDLRCDGNVGPMTLAALRAFLTERGKDGSRVLVNMIAAQQSVRYIELAEVQPSQEAYEFGWQSTRAMFGIA